MLAVQFFRQLSHRVIETALLGDLQCQPQVLDHQVDHETRLVAIAGRRVLHDSRVGVIDLQRPVAPGAGEHDLRQDLRVQAIARAHFQRLAGAYHVDGQQHVVTTLGHLAGAGGTRVENILAHVGQDQPRPGEGLGAAAAHESQGPGSRRGHPTGYRAVHVADTQFGSRLSHPPRRGGVYGAAIKHRGGGVQLRQQSLIPEIDRGDVLAGGQHGEHIVDTRRRGSGTLRHRRARRPQLLAGGLGQIEYRHLVPGLYQVGGHRPAHITQADKCDLCHG